MPEGPPKAGALPIHHTSSRWQPHLESPCLSERPLDLKPYYLADDGSFLITCLPVKALYYWLCPQIHFPLPATTIFTSRGALLTQVFLARLDVADCIRWQALLLLRGPDSPLSFLPPSWQVVWLCSTFVPLQKEQDRTALWMETRGWHNEKSKPFLPHKERGKVHPCEFFPQPPFPPFHLSHFSLFSLSFWSVHHLKSTALQT